MSDHHPLQSLLDKLDRHVTLGDADRRAVLDLPFSERTYQPAAYLVREGEPPRPNCALVTSGFAFRQKLTSDGARQIVSHLFRGDLIDAQHLFLDCADHNVQALTTLKVSNVDREALRQLTLARPAIAQAMWVDVLIEASIFREWMLNNGRRSAREQIAHLICEFAVRMRVAGEQSDGGYALPMTQEQIGDSLGLTSVHVNRMLKKLVEDELIRFDRRQLVITDWDGMTKVADFSTLYLHLDQVKPAGDAGFA